MNSEKAHGKYQEMPNTWDEYLDNDEDEAVAFDVSFGTGMIASIQDVLVDANEEMPLRAPNIDRSRQLYADRLEKDYWGTNPTYSAKAFRRRFRMQRSLFDRILQTL